MAFLVHRMRGSWLLSIHPWAQSILGCVAVNHGYPRIAFWSAKSVRKKCSHTLWLPVCILRSVYCLMSPFLFCIPSTLYTGCGCCRCLMGSLSSFVYFVLMKFSVAPESRSTVVLALFQDRWMNRHNCIDFCMEKYILSDPILLIQAAWIRPPKNFPLGLPSLSSALPDCLLVEHSVVDTGC